MVCGCIELVCGCIEIVCGCIKIVCADVGGVCARIFVGVPDVFHDASSRDRLCAAIFSQ